MSEITPSAPGSWRKAGGVMERAFAAHKWRVDEDQRGYRRTYFGPPDFYISVYQNKNSNQNPIGDPSIEIHDDNVSMMFCEGAEVMVKALRDAIELSRQWEAEKSTTQPTPQEVQA